MYTKINNQDDLSVVTLEQAKMQCRLMNSFTMDDEYLTHLVSLCSELAQTYTKRLLTVGSVTVECDEYFPVLQLPWGGATSIDSVIIDGVATTNYTFSEVTQKIKVNSTYSNIVVTYTCGYLNGKLPTKVKQGVLLMISTLYNNRDDFVNGMNIEEMPLQSKSLLNSVRYYGT